MKENFAKAIVRRLAFPDGATRKIRFGPLKGRRYRVTDITGMSAWYSGPERRQQEAFASILRTGDNVIDAGANWGLHSLLFSSLVGSYGRVAAVEPSPRVREELNWHLKSNACENVSIIPGALSDRCGEAAFVLSSSAYTGHLDDVIGHSDKGCRVQTWTVDALVEEMGFVELRLVKIDVEGAESQVLEGAKETISRLHPFFVVELHTPEQDVRVARLLTESGYEISRLAGPPIKTLETGWPDPDGVWGTIVAKPK